jgi:hypothetical protein
MLKGHQENGQLVEIIRACVNVHSAPPVKLVAISAMGECLWHPSLLAMFMGYLLNDRAHFLKSSAVCDFLLVQSNPLVLLMSDEIETLRQANCSDAVYVDVFYSSSSCFRLSAIPLKWDPWHVAQAFVQHVQAQQLSNLEFEHVRLILACVRSPNVKLDVKWCGEEFFMYLRDYVFVALCDADCVGFSIAIILTFLFSSNIGGDVLANDAFLGSMKLLFPSGEDECQRQVTSRHFTRYDACTIHLMFYFFFLMTIKGVCHARKDTLFWGTIHRHCDECSEDFHGFQKRRNVSRSLFTDCYHE